MTVFRRPAQKNYFASKRTWMQDHRLSCKATGLLARMLSMPQDWDFTQKQLASVMKEGVEAIQSGMKELATHGYLVKMPQKRESGTFSQLEYEVWDAPIIRDSLTSQEVAKIFSHKFDQGEFDKIYVSERLVDPDCMVPVPGFPGPIDPAQQVKQNINKENRQTEDTEHKASDAPASPALSVCSLSDHREALEDDEDTREYYREQLARFGCDAAFVRELLDKRRIPCRLLRQAGNYVYAKWKADPDLRPAAYLRSVLESMCLKNGLKWPSMPRSCHG